MKRLLLTKSALFRPHFLTSFLLLSISCIFIAGSVDAETPKSVESRLDALEKKVVELEEKLQRKESLELPFSNDARQVPYFRNGEMLGYRLFALRTDSKLAKLGLCNGDILKSIDGQAVKRMEHLSPLAEKEKAQLRNLLIERQGVTFDLLDPAEKGRKCENLQPEKILGEKETVQLSKSECEAALANLALTLSHVRMVPYFRQGKSIGMRLFALKSSSIYERMGLLNGDIVLSVNEKSLVDPQIIDFLNQCKGPVDLKLERAGKLGVLTVEYK